MKRFQTICTRIALIYALYGALSNSALAQNLTTQQTGSLRVADPRGAWNRSGQGRIEEALLTVSPCGAYTQCELFLTFSSAGTTLTSAKDSLEVQFDFFMPPEAHITDSWLWVGNDVVQAKIFDRTTATNVYESIVQRRQDPSLLTKNYNGYFNLRVFPMRGNETRKVKISYLVPSDWQESSVYAVLPLSLLRASSRVPDLNVIYYPQNDWTTPRLMNQRESGFNTSTLDFLRQTQELQSGRRVFAGIVSSDNIHSNAVVALEWSSPAQNGVFVQTFTRGSELFYHVIVDARKFLGAGEKDNVEIDNLRLKSSNGTAYDRYQLNLPQLYTNYYWNGGWATGITTRPGIVGAPSGTSSSLYAPFFTFRGTQRIDKNGIIQEVGRLSGTSGLTMSLGGYVNNVPVGVERTIPASALRQGGDCSYLAWMGNHIAKLENEPMNYNFSGVDTALRSRQRRIVQLSVENRVLSRLTAFLALEPNDTTRICATCTQPTTGSPAVANSSSGAASSAAPSALTTVRMATINITNDILYYPAPFMLSASPNPSSGAVTLSLSLMYPIDADASSVTAGIYDALGRLIRVIPQSVIAAWLKQGQVHIQWDGDDDAGRRVSQGLYFLAVQTPTARQTVKIMRWE